MGLVFTDQPLFESDSPIFAGLTIGDLVFDDQQTLGASEDGFVASWDFAEGKVVFVSAGAASNPFDQDLNTDDDVMFNSIELGVPYGVGNTGSMNGIQFYGGDPGSDEGIQAGAAFLSDFVVKSDQNHITFDMQGYVNVDDMMAFGDFGSTLVRVLNGNSLVFTDGTAQMGSTADPGLIRVEDDTLGVRNPSNPTNSMGFSVEGTYTSDTDYERVRLYSTGTTFDLVSESAGTGIDRAIRIRSAADLQLRAGTGDNVDFWPSNTLSWRMTNAALTSVTNSNLGDSSGNHIGNIYANNLYNSTGGGRLQLGVSDTIFYQAIRISDRADYFGYNSGPYWYGDAANEWHQRNGSNAQNLYVYGDYSSPSDYERVNLGFDGTRFKLGAESAGTGTDHQFFIQSQSNLQLGGDRIYIGPKSDSTGHGYFKANTGLEDPLGDSGNPQGTKFTHHSSSVGSQFFGLVNYPVNSTDYGGWMALKPPSFNVAIGNGTDPHSLYVYKSVTDVGNFERLKIGSESGVAHVIESESAGTGTDYRLEMRGSNGRLIAMNGASFLAQVRDGSGNERYDFATSYFRSRNSATLGDASFPFSAAFLGGNTVTVNTPALDITQTLNDGAVAFNLNKYTIVDTASDAATTFSQYWIDGETYPRVQIGKDGSIKMTDGVTNESMMLYSDDNDGYIELEDNFSQLVIRGNANFMIVDDTFVAIPEQLSFHENGSPNGIGDTTINCFETGRMELRQGSNAHWLEIYQDYSSSSDWTRLLIGYTGGNDYFITTEAGGTGTVRNLALGRGGVDMMTFASGKISVASNIRFDADGLRSIGNSGERAATIWTDDVHMPRSMTLIITDPNGDDLTTGDGKFYVPIPPELDGYDLTSVRAEVATQSSSGSIEVQIHNVTDSVDMLSTVLTILASNDADDGTAVIDTANDDVVTNDRLRVDVDLAGTGAKGLILRLGFTHP